MSSPSLISPLILLLVACGDDLGPNAPDSRDSFAGPQGATDFYEVDADMDGYGVSVDCDDTDAAVYPDADEADNLVDDDCDGWIDEDFVAEGDLVISEINRQARFGGTLAVTAGSWFELTNTSDRVVDLSNWVIVRTTTTATRSFLVDPTLALTVEPGGRLVFCETDLYEGSAVAYPLACDYVWTDPTKSPYYAGTYHVNTFHLGVNHDLLRVGIEGGRTTARFIDEVEWFSDATGGYWPKTARFSMSLDDAWLDAARNDDPRAWCTTTANAAGKASNDDTWRWYDTPGTTNDEYGTPGAANYDCPVDVDWDGDGYASAADCNDDDPAINPGAAEVCDGIDNNCDAVVDIDAVDRLVLFFDADADGFGGDTTTLACERTEGWSLVGGDCDDSDAGVNPGATDTCDGFDANCDGTPEPLRYADLDADGFGDPAGATWSCAGEPGLVDDATDCDDTRADVNPAAVEHCDGVDEDCDGEVDDAAVDPIAYFYDDDADGFGGAYAYADCPGDGLPTVSDDCDDTDATIHPAAPETCDGVDEDCDGSVDEGAVDRVERYLDADLDGYGAGALELVCDGAGWVVDGTDCDDTLAAVNPAAPELRDGLDNDCDVTADEGVVPYGELVVSEVNKQSRFGGTALVYAGSWVEVYNTSDVDLDLSNWSFRHTGPFYTRSILVDPADQVVVPAHDYAVLCETATYEASTTAAWPLYCDYVIGDPAQPATYEGTYHNNKLHIQRDYAVVGFELDGVLIDELTWRYDASGYWPRNAGFSMSLDPAYLDADDNDERLTWCSTTADAAGAVHLDPTWSWYDNASTTRDEFGTPGYANYDCPVGPDADGDGVEDALDCAPDDPGAYPGAAEVECDLIDQDCDGTDLCSPKDECNGVDDDGDGTIDEDGDWAWFWQDADGDGYMDIGTATYFCAAPDETWWLADPAGAPDDCDATDPSIHPYAGEIECDGIDQDCDGSDLCTPTGSGDFYDAFGSTNPNGAWEAGWSWWYDARDFTPFDTYSEEFYTGLDIWWPAAYGSPVSAPVFVRSPADAPAWGPDLSTYWPERTVSLHPGPSGEYAALRWTATVATACTLDLTFTELSYGQTYAEVYAAGTSLGAGFVEPASPLDVAAMVYLEAGDTLLLTVSPYGDNSGDTTAIAGTWSCTTDSPTFNWEYVRVEDCTGSDFAGTTSSATPSEALCSAATVGRTAVCWDGVTVTHPAGEWCTYKTTPVAECTGGLYPGFQYTCVASAP